MRGGAWWPLVAWVAALLVVVCAPRGVEGGIWANGQVFQVNNGRFNVPWIKSKSKCFINGVRASCSSRAGGVVVPPGLESGSLRIDGVMRYRNFFLGKLIMCSGQSNMHHPVSADLAGNEIVARADERIHFYGYRSSLHNEVKWSTTAVADISSICYNFALEYLAKNPDVKHVGLIKNAIGRTNLDHWLPKNVKYRPLPAATRANQGILWKQYISKLYTQSFTAILWYQGETNSDYFAAYGVPLRKFIISLQNKWPKAKVIVFGVATSVKGNINTLPNMRKVQQDVTEALPNTGFVHTYDLGDPFQFNENTLSRSQINNCPGTPTNWFGHVEWCRRFSVPPYGRPAVHPRLKSRLGYRAMQAFEGLQNPKAESLTSRKITNQRFEYVVTVNEDCVLKANWDVKEDFFRVSYNGGLTFERPDTSVRLTRVNARKFSFELPSGNAVVSYADSPRPCCAPEQKVCPPSNCGWLSKASELPLDPFVLKVET